jgi:hypothetical protein
MRIATRVLSLEQETGHGGDAIPPEAGLDV